MKLCEKSTAAVGRVDRERGVIHGVKLLGQKSKNSRQYTSAAMREAIPLYRGVKVFLGHPDEDKIFDRDFSDWVGVVENVQLRSDGLYGDIRLRKSGAKFEEICEAAESFSGAFGMSHVADGKLRWHDGAEIIECITEVASVDIVLEPATTCGLFEAVGLDSLDQQLDHIDALVERLRDEPDIAVLDQLKTAVDALVLDQPDEAEGEIRESIRRFFRNPII